MNSDERLLLQKMIKANDVVDQTGLIRKLKHSHLLQDDINNLLKLKHNNATDEKMMQECSFLFSQYTDIFNKIKKNEIDLKILNRFLNVLRSIEDEEIDQHEGSFIVGTLLKDLYIDSALRKSEKLNQPQKEECTHLPISYRNFKSLSKVK